MLIQISFLTKYIFFSTHFKFYTLPTHHTPSSTFSFKSACFQTIPPKNLTLFSNRKNFKYSKFPVFFQTYHYSQPAPHQRGSFSPKKYIFNVPSFFDCYGNLPLFFFSNVSSFFQSCSHIFTARKKGFCELHAIYLLFSKLSRGFSSTKTLHKKIRRREALRKKWKNGYHDQHHRLILLFSLEKRTSFRDKRTIWMNEVIYKSSLSLSSQ